MDPNVLFPEPMLQIVCSRENFLKQAFALFNSIIRAGISMVILPVRCLCRHKTLIARRLDVNAPQGDGMTALHWAADRGDSTMAAELLRAKASVNTLDR